MMRQVPMTPLAPSGLPHDLESFRPVEREEVKDLIDRIALTPFSAGAGGAVLPHRDAGDAARLSHGQGRPPHLARHSQGGVGQEERGGGGCHYI